MPTFHDSKPSAVSSYFLCTKKRTIKIEISHVSSCNFTDVRHKYMLTEDTYFCYYTASFANALLV